MVGTQLQRPQNVNNSEHQFPCDYSSEERTQIHHIPHYPGVSAQSLVQRQLET